MSLRPWRAVARVRGAAGPLSRQLALAVAVVVASVLIALVLVSLLMVVSHHAAVLVGVIVLAAGTIAVLTAWLLAGSFLQDVESIRDGLRVVGAKDDQ
jgi:hypothetical protein